MRSSTMTESCRGWACASSAKGSARLQHGDGERGRAALAIGDQYSTFAPWRGTTPSGRALAWRNTSPPSSPPMKPNPLSESTTSLFRWAHQPRVRSRTACSAPRLVYPGASRVPRPRAGSRCPPAWWRLPDALVGGACYVAAHTRKGKHTLYHVEFQQDEVRLPPPGRHAPARRYERRWGHLSPTCMRSRARGRGPRRPFVVGVLAQWHGAQAQVEAALASLTQALGAAAAGYADAEAGTRRARVALGGRCAPRALGGRRTAGVRSPCDDRSIDPAVVAKSRQAVGSPGFGHVSYRVARIRRGRGYPRARLRPRPLRRAAGTLRTPCGARRRAQSTRAKSVRRLRLGAQGDGCAERGPLGAA